MTYNAYKAILLENGVGFLVDCGNEGLIHMDSIAVINAS